MKLKLFVQKVSGKFETPHLKKMSNKERKADYNHQLNVENNNSSVLECRFELAGVLRQRCATQGVPGMYTERTQAGGCLYLTRSLNSALPKSTNCTHANVHIFTALCISQQNETVDIQCNIF